MGNIYEQLDFSVPMAPIIRMCTSDIQTSIEQETLKACYRIGIEVDKERLVQALTDAGAFFDEGYRAGYEAGLTDGQKLYEPWRWELRR